MPRRTPTRDAALRNCGCQDTAETGRPFSGAAERRRSSMAMPAASATSRMTPWAASASRLALLKPHSETKAGTPSVV